MDQQKQAIADKLKQANNILVTVSNNPSVDQLASCIGVTLALNKMGKHATAVFSGTVPSTIEFLQPEKTIEKNTDSLRDFIIALDKAKADKLRYKVEDTVVKIFITPYRTSISEKDLDFSQGDFNVDVVLALGVHQQTDLDQAITSHGRILHDATVVTINNKPGGELGTINWLQQESSSLSELGVELVDTIDKQLMDGQMATAFLTGIVAETDRFSNEKTSPATMSMSAELMAAGANQKLVATKLEAPAPPPPPPAPNPEPHDEGEHREPSDETPPPKPDDGTLEITHDRRDEGSLPPPPAPEAEEAPKDEPPMPQIHIDEHGSLKNIEEIKDTPKDIASEGSPDAQSPPPAFSSLQPATGERGTTDPTQHMGSAHMILQPPGAGQGQNDIAGGSMAEGLEQPSGAPQSFLPPSDGRDGTAPAGMPSYLPPASATTAAANSFIASSPPPAPPLSQPLYGTPSPSAQTMPTPPPVYAPPAPPPPAPAPPPPVSAVTPLSSPFSPPPPASGGDSVPQTLTQIERGVDSPHLQPPPPSFAPPTGPASPFSSPSGPSFAPPPPPNSFAASPTASPPAAEPGQVLPDIESAREAVRQAIASPTTEADSAPAGQLHQPPAPEVIAPPVLDTPPPVVAQTVAPPAQTMAPIATPTPMPGGMASFNPSVIQPNTTGATNSGMPPPPGPPPMMPQL